MKKNIPVILALAIALSLAVYSFKASPSVASSPERWEYTCFQDKASQFDESLIPDFNRLGEEGWELVAVAPAFKAYWFKRKIK